MAVTEDWIPVALSTSIEPGSSAGVMVAGTELVVWRDNKGEAHVWEDRCPHRGMRMSFGFVRGDHIACLYHGWAYDTAGQCQYIPAHPDLEVPKTIRIRTYGVAEQAGLIWTRLADAEEGAAETVALPEAASPVRSLYAAASLGSVLEALRQAPFRTADGEAVMPTVETAGPASWRYKAGPIALFIAGQEIADGKIALHIVLLGSSEAADRRAIARWAEALRLMLENAAPAGATLEYA